MKSKMQTLFLLLVAVAFIIAPIAVIVNFPELGVAIPIVIVGIMGQLALNDLAGSGVCYLPKLREQINERRIISAGLSLLLIVGSYFLIQAPLQTMINIYICLYGIIWITYSIKACLAMKARLELMDAEHQANNKINIPSSDMLS